MENNRVKFIDYTGRYPNLCRGLLRIEINGEELALSNVLESGGTWGFDEDWNDYVTHGAWKVDLECYPELKEFENETNCDTVYKIGKEHESFKKSAAFYLKA